MGIIILIGKYVWCFSLQCKAKGYEIQLNMKEGMFFLNAQGRSTRELKPKHKWDKAVNQGMKQMLSFI